MDAVIKLLDEIEEMLDRGKVVPFSGKISIDKDDFYSIIGEIRAGLPGELKQAKWVIDERNKILVDAQREADEIIKTAEDLKMRMIDDNEVTKQAYEQAATILDNAKHTANEVRLGAIEYADDLLSDAESKVRELKNVLYEENMKTDDYFGNTLQILNDNIQELRLGK